MSEYINIPMAPVDVIRGNHKQILFMDFVVDDAPIDLTTACVKVQFKSSIDAGRCIDFDMTVDNGRMTVTSDRLTLIFDRWTSKMPLNTYYGDVLMKINGQDHTAIRIELNLSGVVTTKENDEC